MDAIFGGSGAALRRPRRRRAQLALGAAQLGDTWLLGALATLAASPALLRQLFVSTRGRGAGVYTVQVFVHDEWVQVMVDDRLPCDPSTREPLYVRSCRHGELWPCLVEKALAKLHGSYAALHGGSFARALRDLTGGVPRVRPSRELGWADVEATLAADAPLAFYASGTAPPPESNALAFEIDRGDLLTGLLYPVLQSSAQAGKRQLLLGCPWGGSGSGSGGGAAADAPSAGLWLEFDEVCARLNAAVSVSLAATHQANPTVAAHRRTLSASDGGFWPPPHAPSTMADDERSGDEWPAVFELNLPVGGMLTVLLSQALPPASAAAAEPPSALALLLVPRDADGVALRAVCGRQPLPAASVVEHTLPPRPQRDVVLAPATPLPAGDYLILAHRCSSMPTGDSRAMWAVARQRCVVDVCLVPSAGAELGSPARRGAVARPTLSLLTAPPPAPPNSSTSSTFTISGDAQSGPRALSRLLWEIGSPSPPAEDESAALLQIERLTTSGERRAAAAKIQAASRAKHERSELAELKALQSAQMAAAAAVATAAARGALGRKQARARRQARAAADDAEAQSQIAATARAEAATVQAAAAARAAAARAAAAAEASELREMRRLEQKVSSAASALQARAPRGRSARRDPVKAATAAAGGGSSSAVLERLASLERQIAKLARAPTSAAAAAAPAPAALSAEEAAAAVAALRVQARAEALRGVDPTSLARRGAHLEDVKRSTLVVQSRARGMAARRQARELKRLEVASDFEEMRRGWPHHPPPHDPARVGADGAWPKLDAQLLYVPRQRAAAAVHDAIADAMSRRGVDAATWTATPAHDDDAADAAADAAAAAALPEVLVASDAAASQAASYRSAVVSLQRDQHSLLAAFALAHPQRAARLTVQKDEALQLLAQQAAQAAQTAGRDDAAALHREIAEQRHDSAAARGVQRAHGRPRA